ncbi:M50 family metallopeptidase [Brevibacterium sp. VCM10]|uniref:M50 family metallopeptidase n=1 Tax=Brevibacterium sp. VCM10 TaxID=1381751 RepID=UPI0004711A7E|nr:M50 family metallopeptidase [Brevibacterium sp. VCM10]
MDFKQATATWWGAITSGFGRQDGLELDVLGLVLVIGIPLVVTLTPAVWRFFGLFVTFVHELGHAFAALMTGRVVKGISLNFDHSGQMNSFGRVGFSATWAGFWGYPAPGVLGLVLATSAVFGWAPLALSVGALILLVALIFIRNFAGAVIAVITAIAAQLVVVFLPLEWISVFVAALGTALTIGSLKDLVKVIRVHTRRRHVQQSDAYILAQGSALPSGAWLTLFALVILVCALATARVLYTAVSVGAV